MAGMSGTRRKDLNWTPVDARRLKLNQRVAVVGGTNGIGRALALLLAERGAKVAVVGRTFRDQGVAGLSYLAADLTLMSEVRRVARELPAEELDLLVLTTGIFAGPKREQTSEGLEKDLAVSYLSRVVLVKELAPRLGKGRPAGSPKPRVFVMGFPGTDQKGDADDLNSEKKYESFAAHMNTVAGNEALVLDAARRYPDVLFYGLNPGLIKSDIRSNVLGGNNTLRFRLVEGIIGLAMQSAEKYARRIVPLMVSPDLEPHTAAMFNAKAVPIMKSPTFTDEHVAKLMGASEALLKRAQ